MKVQWHRICWDTAAPKDGGKYHMMHVDAVIKDAGWELTDCHVLFQFINSTLVATAWLLCQAKQHYGADVKSGAGVTLVLCHPQHTWFWLGNLNTNYCLHLASLCITSSIDLQVNSRQVFLYHIKASFIYFIVLGGQPSCQLESRLKACSDQG